MTRAGSPRSESGFTLLEVVISMTLMSVVVGMAYSGFATAMNAVPRGEAAADRSARLRMATALITRQVRSMVNYPAWSNQEVHPFFHGDANSFGFVTAAPQLNGGEGLGWVEYALREGDFLMAERAIFSMAAVSGDGPDPQAETVLLRGIKEGTFQYLRMDGLDNDWLGRWDALEEQGLPGAIRITLDGLGIGDSYWIQEIPVMTVVYGLGTYDSELGLFEDFGGEPPEFDEEENSLN